jgi:hypothetical protein
VLMLANAPHALEATTNLAFLLTLSAEAEWIINESFVLDTIEQIARILHQHLKSECVVQDVQYRK